MIAKRKLLKLCSKLMIGAYRPPAGVLFPCAHAVCDEIPDHIKHLRTGIGIAKFKADIDFLCRRYQPLQLSEIERIQNGSGSDMAARYFVLSFDDGLRDVYDVISPILREKGVPAIFFVNSSTIDNKQLLWRHKISLLIEQAFRAPGRLPPQLGLRSTEMLAAQLKASRRIDERVLDDIARFFEVDFNEYLRRVRPYLTAAQILELASQGFEFGAHSDTHPYFNQISAEEQKGQVSRSVLFVRGLGVPCRYFAFPFHDDGVPGSIFVHMRDLGIALSFGTCEARFDSIPFSFQRFALDGDNSDSTMEELLKELSTKSLLRRLSGTDVVPRN